MPEAWFEMGTFLDKKDIRAKSSPCNEDISTFQTDPFQQFKLSTMEWLFSFDHNLLGFRSKYIALTDFDTFPGSGALVVLHCVAVCLGVLLMIRGDADKPGSSGFASCVQPVSASGVQTMVILEAYGILCMQSFASLLLIMLQHRLLFYNRSTLYQAKKLGTSPERTRSESWCPTFT
jgi:hypothetical protein